MEGFTDSGSTTCCESSEEIIVATHEKKQRKQKKKKSSQGNKRVSEEQKELTSLRSRVSNLEILIAFLTKRIEKFENEQDEKKLQKKEMKDISTQIDKNKTDDKIEENSKLLMAKPSYAEKVKTTPGSTPLKSYSEDDVEMKYGNAKINKKSTSMDNRGMSSQQMTTKHPKTKTNQSKKDENENQSKVSEVSEEEENMGQLPEVWFVHDSILNGVDLERLGRSYDFESTNISTSKVEDIQQVLNKTKSDLERAPQAIVIHCGINNIRSSDANAASKTLISTVQKVEKQFPKSKILLSEITPVKNNHMELKRKLFNAQIATEFEHSKQTSIITHPNMNEQKIQMKDHLHPNKSGSSTLAGNIGRAVRSKVWSQTHQQRRAGRRFSSRHPWISRQFKQELPWSSSYHRPNLKLGGPWGSRYSILDGY